MASAKDVRGTTHISFVCQKCYQPLKLDNSIISLDGETLTELTGEDGVFHVVNEILIIN